jgi:ABC-2 type transport system ATP-binding protein
VESAPLIEIAALTKKYPGADSPAVDGVELVIARGRVFGLLGPNGAGKTTLMSMICGLLAPDRGSIRFDGIDLARDGGVDHRRIGLVPQDLALYPTLTARENLAFFGGVQGLGGAELRRRIDWCLEAAGLEALADRRVETFSGGLKRRLNLVVALIHEPELLILDEPTVGIDPQSRRFIHDKLKALNAAGLTILYTSHYMEEVEQLCDELAIIDHGHIVARGTLDQILGRLRGGLIQIRVATPLPAGLHEQVRALPGLRDVRLDGSLITLLSETPQETLAQVLALLRAAKHETSSVSLGPVNLEQVFLALTGTTLRDGA